MTRLDRFILGEIVGLFLGGVLLFTGVFFAAGEIQRFAAFLQNGTGLLIVGQLILFTLPNVLAFTFPMAMLLATLLGFGRLSDQSEIVALTAAGVRFERIMVPVAGFAACVAGVGFWLNNNLAPYASEQRNVLIARVNKGEVGSGLLAKDIFPRKFNTAADQFVIVNAEGVENLGRGELRGVSVERWQDGKPVAFIYAPRATWEVGTVNWTFDDYTLAALPDVSKNQGGAFATARTGGTTEYKQALDTPAQLALLRGRPEDTSTAQLRRRASIYRASGKRNEALSDDVYVAKRLSLPWASLAFALIGAPLGVRPQRGGKGVGFGLSIIITFAYWIALDVASVVGKSGAISPDVALWLPNIACFGLGIYLIRRVLR